jgi:hypothetical protein
MRIFAALAPAPPARLATRINLQDSLKTTSVPDGYVAGKDVPGYFAAREEEMKTLLAAIH